MFLGEDIESNDQLIFDLVWSDFDSWYALFEVKDVDWDSLYTVYHPLIGMQPIWTILTNMMDELNDGHTTLHNLSNGDIFESGDLKNQQALLEFDLDLVVSKYLDSLFMLNEEGTFLYGSLTDEIGYLYIEEMDGNHPEEIRHVVAEFESKDALVIDVRNNGGGSDDFAHRVAGAFADDKRLIYTVQTRNGPQHSDFDEPTGWFAEPRGTEQFTRPIVVLTDRFTASAAEIFMYNMLSFPHVTHVGDSTAGDFSDISNSRFLPNGWLYTMSHQLYLDPAGNNFDGVGFAPEIYIKNTEADIAAEQDLVLEAAIDFLD
jgi:hypothetical protein